MFKNIKKHFIIALQFLTVLPVKVKGEVKDKNLGKSLLFFPAAGLVIGLILAALALIFGHFSAFLTAAIVLTASVILTGGLHLDGFADTCDGFYVSGSGREKTLEVMRDTHVGAMGVIGIACVLIFKFALLSSVAPNMLWRAAAAMAVFSRWAMSFACLSSVYARPEGKAKAFMKNADKKEVIAGAVFTLLAILGFMGIKGISIFILASIVVFLFIKYSKQKIGGMTGDTLGAVNEIGGTVFLLLAVIL